MLTTASAVAAVAAAAAAVAGGLHADSDMVTQA
jgi:hypothetical protein